MEIRIRTETGIATRLNKEIVRHGISKYYVRPFEQDQVEFVFLSLSEHQQRLLSYTLKKYSYIATFIR
ncbi:hypothetical protein [Brevibacillus borstelensis]|uniref:hypothetical protein n=1 Tax=Brevibacillus borstelensis TaxID=45462 RepID=UPI0030C23304